MRGMTKPDPKSSRPAEQAGTPASALVRLVRALARMGARSSSDAATSKPTASDSESGSEPEEPGR